MKTKFLTIGADPEFFLKSTVSDEIISVEGLLGGTKDEPKPLGEYFVQEDNVMVEFNIPPCVDDVSFERHITTGISEISKFFKPKNLIPYLKSSAEFSEEQLNTEKAKEFGCSVDFDAWSETENPKVQPPVKLRFAGGHVHCGYEDPDINTTLNLIKMFDLILGLPAVIIDNDEERKKIYGTAGRFRLTSYGFEYRTLSNFWISDSNLIKWVFNSVKNIFDNYEEYKNYISDTNIQLAINTNDKNLAKNLCEKYKVHIPNFEFSKETEKVLA